MEIGNWIKTRQDCLVVLSCLVFNCVHTVDTDKTGQSCLVRVGDVNKLMSQSMFCRKYDALDLELVVGSSMIEIVTQRTDKCGKSLHVTQVCPYQTAALFNHTKHNTGEGDSKKAVAYSINELGADPGLLAVSPRLT